MSANKGGWREGGGRGVLPKVQQFKVQFVGGGSRFCQLSIREGGGNYNAGGNCLLIREGGGRGVLPKVQFKVQFVGGGRSRFCQLSAEICCILSII